MNPMNPMQTTKPKRPMTTSTAARRWSGWLALAAAMAVAAGCAGPAERPAAWDDGPAVVSSFLNDTNVRNPAARDAYPEVLRVVVRAVDGRRVQGSRVRLEPGEHKLTLEAIDRSGRTTWSEATVSVEAGRVYAVLPEPGEGGEVLAIVREGLHGAEIGRSRRVAPE